MSLATPHNPDSVCDDRPQLLDHTSDSLVALFADWNEPTYRAKQVLEWVYAKGATDYQEMSNLPNALREKLSSCLPIYTSNIAQQQRSRDGTTKLLLRWPSGETSECVLLPDGERRTACISTQVGCPVGCVFCASGLDGLSRQLSAGQIVEQAMRIAALCSEADGAKSSSSASRLTNVVFMGLGEPLANYDATVAAVRTINASWGLAVGARKITVSTVGLPTQIKRLADEGLQITLALSLHAPTDELRKQLIPWAERVTIDTLFEAINEYFAKTGREITLEYILIADVNDSPVHARQLAHLSRKIRSNVNLIAYNPVEGLPYRRPTDTAVDCFLETLRECGTNAHVRRSRGRDIDGACGQLRRRHSSPGDSSANDTSAFVSLTHSVVAKSEPRTSVRAESPQSNEQKSAEDRSTIFNPVQDEHGDSTGGPRH